MKKKLTDNQRRLILCFVILLIFVLAYQFIYTRYEDKAQNFETKTEAVRQQIAQRESDLAQENTLTQQTADMNKSIDTVITAFPVKLMKEDNLIFIEDMERALAMDIPSVDVLDTKEFYTTVLPIRNEVGLDMLAAAAVSTDGTQTSDGTTTSAAVSTPASAADGTSTSATDGTTAAADSTTTTGTTGNATATGDLAGQPTDTQTQYMKALVCPINISFQTTEKQFIKVLDYINKNPERTSVAGASLDYDSSSGELICNMTINRYVLIGSGKEYKEPEIGNISIGTDNLFGTGK